MSNNVFTLDSLREEVEKKFAPVKIGLSDGSEVVLPSLLRLSKESREEFTVALEDLKNIDDDDDSPENVELAVEAVSKVIGAVADKPRELLKELAHEDKKIQLHLTQRVMDIWFKETQLGEA
jgi:hypothetical protein